jgi:hypothetical protein
MSLEPGDGGEVLCHSERTRVVRRFLPGGALIVKEPQGPGAPRRARHEAAILERLAGVEGVSPATSMGPP